VIFSTVPVSSTIPVNMGYKFQVEAFQLQADTPGRCRRRETALRMNDRSILRRLINSRVR
jgi:hypothetical protein